MDKKNYQAKKEWARDWAEKIHKYINDNDFAIAVKNHAYFEIEKLGKRYGLLKEFKDKGLI